MNDQGSQSEYECDCAIIGGGVSELCAGWRLLNGAGSFCQGKKVALFDMSNRLGG
jgi:protoporphyrinogen oxidase